MSNEVVKALENVKLLAKEIGVRAVRMPHSRCVRVVGAPTALDEVREDVLATYGRRARFLQPDDHTLIVSLQ